MGRYLLLLLAVIGGLIPAMRASALDSSVPLVLQPEKILSEPGVFSWQRGRLLLHNHRTSAGDLRLTVTRQRRNLFWCSGSDPITELQIPAGYQWFCSLDALERLWLYVGPDHGSAAEPSLECRVVYLIGNAIGSDGQVAFTIQNVIGSRPEDDVFGTQQWQGVPTLFLEEVRQALFVARAASERLPEQPPAFTRQQELSIQAANNQ